jgi:hypothetical protein
MSASCAQCAVGATISCASTCICVPSFYDANCSSSFYASRPATFTAFNALTLTLYLLLAAFGIVLATVYFVKVASHVKRVWKNPQVLGILALIVACLFRFINAAIFLGYGPAIGEQYFRSPTHVYGVIEGFYELFYPLVIAAFALQIVLWMIFVIKSNQSKRTNSC